MLFVKCVFAYFGISTRECCSSRILIRVGCRCHKLMNKEIRSVRDIRNSEAGGAGVFIVLLVCVR